MPTVHGVAKLDVASASAPSAAKLAQFFIPAAASLQERRPRTLKHGDTFGLFDHNGDALPGEGSPEGLYHCDTRYLSFYNLTINGGRPMLLSSTPRDDNAALIFDLTNPDLEGEAGEGFLEHDLIHIRRLRFLWNARVLREAGGEKLRYRAAPGAPRRLVRLRFRRSVRSARQPSRRPRRRASAGHRPRLRDLALHRPRSDRSRRRPCGSSLLPPRSTANRR